jgi:hypothetical protein
MKLSYHLTFAPLLLLPLVGCDSNSEIEVTRVPKEIEVVKAPATDPHAGVPMPSPGAGDPHAGIPMPTPGAKDPHAGVPLTGAPGTARKPSVDGEVPASWEPGRGSSMRLASYLVKGEGDAVADISLIILGGQAGGVLDNVNRWRTQIGLAPLDAQGLTENSVKLTTPVGEAVVVDLAATGPVANPAQDGRIVAAIVPLARAMWFYKMRGNRELIEREKEGFLRWVETARKKERAQSAPDPHAPAPAMKNPHAPAPGTPPAARPREITWQVPQGWKEGPAKSMRIATFAISGENGTSGEATVVKLSGTGGGELANVNRWRGQIGLAPITAEELAAAVTSVDSPGGAITLIDCAGTEKRTLAGWLTRNGGTWFFKLNGPTGLVEAEKTRFTSFLSSVDFPAK